MMTNMSLEALKVAVELLAFWVFIFYFWRDYRLDAFRDDLFAARDELFLYAAKGGMSFEQPAYRQLRDRINALLRYAHRFTMTGLFIAMVHPPQRSSELVQWGALVEAMPSIEAQNKLKSVQLRVSMIVLKHMLLRSFSVYLLYLLLQLVSKVVEIKNRISGFGKVIPAVEILESEVVESEASSRRAGRAAMVGA